jgi:hypothetical protein
MLDDLRNSSKSDDTSSFFQQDDMSEIEPMLQKKPKKTGTGLNLNMNVKINSNTFLGMNAFQRFVISLLLFLVVCIMGSMLLMLTGAISLF